MSTHSLFLLLSNIYRKYKEDSGYFEINPHICAISKLCAMLALLEAPLGHSTTHALTMYISYIVSFPPLTTDQPQQNITRYYLQTVVVLELPKTL